ncbi:efflux RND transporter periplasmic adaptor subunit [Frigidibacter mobilis]|uniref:efflux RND transporter periplasmic adaptor subunit n=1 Tax=Frigidibacter mobilis TaxID=1335048 RepID=UPI001412B620|nr:efflux RND transporter periplasmic adaptor subunit [Frigidibacter mobilis]
MRITTAALATPLQEVSLTGTLEPIEAFAVSFPQGGRVISIIPRAGDRIVVGQELARVDPTQTDTAVRAASANLVAAESSLREAQQASDRSQELLARGAGTRADFDNATRSLLAARAARDQAEAELAKAQTSQDNTVLHAFRAGTVTKRSAEPGQVVNPGQQVLEIAADAGLEAVFNAPDGIDLEAFLGNTVTLDLVDQPGLTLAGTITEISPLVDPDTRSVVLKARLDSSVPAGAVFGSPVVGHLTLAQAPVVTLPWAALTALAGGAAVWTVDPVTMTAGQVPVTVGSYGDDTVRLTAGVEPGALVVTDGSQLLFPGRLVAPVEAGN